MNPALAQEINVKLGVLNDRSGVYADLSGEGSVIAAQMAVEDFKAADKGMKVEIISADHQNKPDIGSSIARKWYDEEGVNAILDVPTSSVALAVADITAEKNGVLINSGAGSTELTQGQCKPTTIHWTYDTAALANGTGKALTDAGGKKWFFITADYAFGQSLQENTAKVVEASGGEVVGNVDAPFPTTDFSSYLLQAQGSGADVIGLANAGGDTVNAIKQASEFGITQAGQKLAALLFFITDVQALGAQTAQGLSLTSAFYWDRNDATREWSKRFMERHGAEPTMVQAGVYSGTLQYLKAVEALGSAEDGKAVAAKMKESPFDDPLFGKGSIRGDGRAIHDMYLYEVKTPAESTGEWDLYKEVATISGEDAFLPMLEECDFTKQ
ncbi:MAG: ABC transporter substrate-binding protein [Paracoccus sp. (in: a-proteobacteria)]|uniref:ABC transporter substrate-binding protein n=2 Tax=Paracoccus TaxID=265 RepID=UPI000C524774|nr:MULTISPECIES: ABC transporter substrate-binding protein [unclassified Paracoccus (in: a-proteobacteria)]MAN10869.1 ABC transporter permease [Sphingobium sp.]MAN57959.1 ABC transporter permease [Paracoccus sp. (in: a-proteobacteria)]MBA47488.1 ABC transporter permease [Paracoccus sp. (in: a-proteobacteria)]MCS5601748.1 ABC transporter substrate-binding protein [Paracoccus sp. (in: a-proteobacteria)]MDB2551657.1 ABC transporter substrate-binding protein [Paracoccus sp. (in: a-proteobacteria)]